jgi:hypothetical protein
MRILTEEELTAVFGGDSTIRTTNLAGYTVNATSVANPSVPFSEIGGIFSPTGYGEYGSACYYNGVGGALSHVPSNDTIRCFLSATADPGWDIAPGYRINFVNDFAFAPLNGDISALTMQPSSIAPSGKPGMVYGVTQEAANAIDYHVITIFAGTRTTFQGGAQYEDPATGVISTVPALGVDQTVTFIAAHEAAHTQGVPASQAGEILANGYGMHAVARLNALSAAHALPCPSM